MWAAESSKESNGRLDVLSWLGKMTLDVIGLAGVSILSDCSARPLYRSNFFLGFDYQFEGLTNGPKENELNRALSTVFRPRTSMPLIPMLRGMVPLLRFLVCQNQMLPPVQSIAHIALYSASKDGR